MDDDAWQGSPGAAGTWRVPGATRTGSPRDAIGRMRRPADAPASDGADSAQPLESWEGLHGISTSPNRKGIGTEVPPTTSNELCSGVRSALPLIFPLQRRWTADGSARRGGARDRAAFAVSAGMRCQRTPADGHEPAGPQARWAAMPGAFLFGDFLFRKEKVTRPQGCGRNTQGRESVLASHPGQVGRQARLGEVPWIYRSALKSLPQ